VADRFPSFNLVGEYGGASTELQDVLESPNIIWNLLLQIAQPVLDGGRRTAEVERSEAVFGESLARYQQALIFAFTEVEDSITEGRATEQRLRMLEERVAASEGEMRLSLDRYLQGLSDYLPVLTAQRRLFEAESALLTEKRQLLSDRIALARALGGGWTDDVLNERLAADNSGKEDEQ
jgi:outer membrane protein TolC